MESANIPRRSPVTPDRREVRSDPQVRFMKNSKNGEGFYLPGGYYQWIRIYQGNKAIATFYLCENITGWVKPVSEHDNWSGERNGQLWSISLAKVTKGQAPRPWAVYSPTHFGLGQSESFRSKIEIMEWFEVDYSAVINGMTKEQRKALRRWVDLQGELGDTNRELFPDWESMETYRNRLPDMTDEQLIELNQWWTETVSLQHEQRAARFPRDLHPNAYKGQRSISKVYPVPVPGGDTRWQFPGFKVPVSVLAPVLWEMRKAGVQQVEVQHLRGAIDRYQKSKTSRDRL